MLPAMKVSEKLHNNYITATERYSRPPARYTEASLVKTRARNWSSVNLCAYYFNYSQIMLRKEILTVREKIYTISLAVGKLEEKLLKENTGSDKGKLVPTDMDNRY
jgi:DNA topoisomerase-1